MRGTIADQLRGVTAPAAPEGPRLGTPRTRVHLGLTQFFCTVCVQWVGFRTLPTKHGGFACQHCLLARSRGR